MSERKTFGAILILGSVFLIGGVFGFGGTVFYLKQTRDSRHERGDRFEQRSPRDVYRVQVDRMTSRLERSLDLNEEQIPLVRAEIEKFGNAMRQVHEDMKPQFDALMHERSLAIEQHLNEEQQNAFREQRKQHRERSKAKREEGGKSGDGHKAWKSKSMSNPSACHVSSCGIRST